MLVVAHSMGTHVALDLAARQGPSRVAGLCLLAPVSLRRHKGLEPWATVQAYGKALDLPMVGERVFKPVLREIYVHMLGFSRKYTPADECAHSLRRIVALDFDQAAKDVAKIRADGIPSMVCWADDDHLLQPEIAEELGSVLPSGPRMFFKTGGHFMNKHHAEDIANEILEWDPWRL